MEESAHTHVHEARLWYAMLARGGLALLFAMLTIANPHPWMPLGRLAVLFGGYAILDGALALYAAARVRRTHTVEHGRVLAIEGILSAGFGIAALLLPPVGWLRLLGGIRALVVGTSEVLWSRRASDLVELGGIVTFCFGVIILGWPGPGYVALPWLLGLSTFVTGALIEAGSFSHFRSEETVESV